MTRLRTAAEMAEALAQLEAAGVPQDSSGYKRLLVAYGLQLEAEEAAEGAVEEQQAS